MSGFCMGLLFLLLFFRKNGYDRICEGLVCKIIFRFRNAVFVLNLSCHSSFFFFFLFFFSFFLRRELLDHSNWIFFRWAVTEILTNTQREYVIIIKGKIFIKKKTHFSIHCDKLNTHTHIYIYIYIYLKLLMEQLIQQEFMWCVGWGVCTNKVWLEICLELSIILQLSIFKWVTWLINNVIWL